MTPPHSRELLSYLAIRHDEGKGQRSGRERTNMAASDASMGGPGMNTGSCARGAPTLRYRNSAEKPRTSLTVVTCTPQGRALGFRVRANPVAFGTMREREPRLTRWGGGPCQGRVLDNWTGRLAWALEF